MSINFNFYYAYYPNLCDDYLCIHHGHSVVVFHILPFPHLSHLGCLVLFLELQQFVKISYFQQ